MFLQLVCNRRTINRIIIVIVIMIVWLCVLYVIFVSFGQGSSLLWTHSMRPFYSRPIALTQEGRSLVNDVCGCVRD